MVTVVLTRERRSFLEYMNVNGGDVRVYLGIVSVGMPLTTGGDEPYFKAMLCVLRPDSFRVME